MARRKAALTLAVTLAAIVLLIVTMPSWPAAQAPPFESKYFSSYARAHRITIRRNGSLVTTFDVPVGVYLSVYSEQRPVRTAQEGRVEFHGNVEIRTLPRADVQRPGPGDSELMMLQAPLVIAAQNVDVVSETVIP
ncbi:MAG TPA: hypothetical protein VN654_06120 [Vicinamibacterales bacterium]|jgi:hypothetical protein|nr:hypothetical protein [Vicinamibacterales bacterium]